MCWTSFNLHLRTDLIANVWVVQKPTSDGVVTSVEAFDASGNNMAMFFGERKPGQPELQGWRDLVAGLPRKAAVRRPHEHPRHFSTPGSALAGCGRGGYGPAGPGTDRRCRARSEAAGVAQRRTDRGGLSAQCPEPAGGHGHHQPVPEAAQKTAKVGYVRQLSAEGLLSLKPDAVIATSEAGPPVVLDQIRQAGVRVSLVAARHNWAEVRKRSRSWGARQVAPARPTSCWPSSMRSGAACRPRWPRPSASRACCLCSHSGSPQVAGKGTAANALIQYAGCVNVIDQFDGYKP
jgi:hypothetical protein